MIFETLYESARRGELMLIEGGFCHWHLRRDGQITIREIISTRRGAGKEMLQHLKNLECNSIYAKCPTKLAANEWYKKNGFILEEVETTKKQNKLNCWRLVLG